MTDESSAAAASKRRNSALRFFAIDDIAECLDVSMRGDGPACTSSLVGLCVTPRRRCCSG